MMIRELPPNGILIVKACPFPGLALECLRSRVGFGEGCVFGAPGADASTLLTFC